MPAPVKALVVPAADSAYVTLLDVSLPNMQRLVDGYVELLNLPGGVSMYLNEEGKIKGLPVNGAANRLIAVLGDPGLAYDDFIVGNVVLLGAVNASGESDGEDYDVPQHVLEQCRIAMIDLDDQTQG